VAELSDLNIVQHRSVREDEDFIEQLKDLAWTFREHALLLVELLSQVQSLINRARNT
jgi:hypothetical protein